MSKNSAWRWSAAKTARKIREGDISAREVAEAHLARMKAVNPALNAVVYDMSAQALAAADAADRLQASGAATGPLHGVPITIKENVDVKGMPNPNGVKALEGVIAPDDSPVARNLRQAGAVILGLTNTPEFSFRGFTENQLHGRTSNPWDDSITCGGSSGGAGAAVAMGIGCIAHGNDIGGSLRWPAHCNGVATIKPTQGRIPAFNPSATIERPMLASLMSCQGPLARGVGDVRLALSVMAQRDPRDPWWVPAPLEGPKPEGAIRVAKAKIPADMECDREVMAVFDKAADHLANAGYSVQEVEVPDLSGVWRTWANIIMNETRVTSEQAMRAVASDDFKQTLDGFLTTADILDEDGWMKATAARSAHIRAWQMFFETYPVVLTPTTVKRTPGPRADLGGDAAVRQLFWNDLRFISALNVLGLPAAVVPVALVGGHPVGVQIVAGRYREDLCLDAAQAIEDQAGVLYKKLWKRKDKA